VISTEQIAIVVNDVEALRNSFLATRRRQMEDPARSQTVSLNSKDPKFAYVVWKLSDDGKHLRLRNVNDKVVPKETKDSATVVALLNKNTRKPELFGDEIESRKEK
jgi:uncharacterized LabA/DUF88 family protein